MADSTTSAEPKAIDLTATSDSESSEISEQSRKSRQLEAQLQRSIEAATRDQLREAVILLCKEVPDTAAKLQSILPSPNIAPPRRRFQAVRGHKPKLGRARPQLASRAARKFAPSLDVPTSSSEEDEGKNRKKRKIERYCIHCEGDAADPDGCCKEMRMERARRVASTVSSRF